MSKVGTAFEAFDWRDPGRKVRTPDVMALFGDGPESFDDAWAGIAALMRRGHIATVHVSTRFRTDSWMVLTALGYVAQKGSA